MFEEIDEAMEEAEDLTEWDPNSLGYSLGIVLRPLLRREQARQYREEWERRLAALALEFGLTKEGTIRDSQNVPIPYWPRAVEASHRFGVMHARMLAGERPPEEP